MYKESYAAKIVLAEYAQNDMGFLKINQTLIRQSFLAF
jgi:hypothetical protein